MNIVEVLCRHAALHPAAPAILDVHLRRSRSLSFGDLELHASRGAALLKQAGVGAGDGVLIFHPMSAELYTALIGVFRLGAIAMFLDPSAGRAHIDRCCRLWPPKALIASSKAHLLRLVSPELRSIPRKFVIGMPVPGAISWSHAAGIPATPEIHSCMAATPALITFTSGSTGEPKAAMRTHEFLLAQHRVLQKSLAQNSGDVDLTTLPMFVLANLGSGVTSVIPDANLRSPGSIDPAPVIAQIQDHKAVSTAASPAFLERLADYCSTQQVTLGSVKKIFVGGAPVFPGLLCKLRNVAPEAELTVVYGSTEAEPIAEIKCSTMCGGDWETMRIGRGLLVGSPIPDIRLRILRYQWRASVGPYAESEFEAASLPAGEAGEIVVSGEHVLTRYVHGRGDQETNFNIAGRQWHRTGDAGYLDAQGRLWLLGRCDARIEDPRGVLYSFTVECVARQFPGVRRAAAVLHQGKRLLAVELEPGVRQADVASLKEAVAWAYIDSIKVFSRIPVDKRHNAKINYPELHKLLR